MLKVWNSRVPTHANVADAPSRQELERIKENVQSVHIAEVVWSSL